ncbi:MAG: SUMF1/EgtB/PvdO family nonheme iron enzyme [Deltaproteobacteria bacterium]|jgi:formylglycine-generating enzyme required for sulfatase activity|nr:SUMF1/EgtB/PvdO family nonheme iron enzyme [Deltaproteobacteria bacterium]MBW2530017.1 SUMF1/EgtB/PvdO family nonheme iron enzyme [Deltaproteobacteria bacterium]
MFERHVSGLVALAVGSALALSCTEDPDRVGGTGGSGGGLPSGPTPGEAVVQSSDGTVYYVDRTEVTRDDYAAWLATSPTIPLQIEPCRGNDDLAPTCRWPPGDQGQHPVVCVDWCDARLYCDAQGKRLCGLIAGGPNDYHDFRDPDRDQWYNGCSAQGVDEYPYGAPYDPHRCNGALHGRGTTAPVASLPGCTTASGLLDMSGNVREWKDACETDTSSVAFNYCRLGGGSFRDGELRHLTCNSPGQDALRTGHWDSIGFRCCRDAPGAQAGAGGGAGHGGAPPSGDPCNGCLASSCTAEDAACLANEDCILMSDCTASCFTQECIDSCEAAHPAGVADFDQLESCFEQQCASACG